MKVLFVQSGLHEIINEYPPVGVCYLASIVRDLGYTVDLYDAGAAHSSLDGAFACAVDFKPDIVCLSMYTVGLLEQYAFLKRIKKNFPDCTVITGGPHATALPEYTVNECQDIDFLVFGEGEKTIVELLSALERGEQNLNDIQGLCWRSNGKAVRNVPRELLVNLDDIPFPAYDLLRKNGFSYGRRSLNLTDNVGVILSSRGCPASCDFCFKATFGSKLRRRSSQNVVAEMKWQMEEFGVEEFQFVDDLFAINPKWLDGFFAELRQENVNVPWKCLSRVNSVKEDDFKKMYEHGCYGVEFGVESGNDEVLRDIVKGTNINQVRKTFKIVRKIGLLSFGFFILGLRKDTHETIKQTVQFAKEISPDLCGFATLLPYPGSAVHIYLPEDLKYKWDNFRSYYDKNALPLSLCSVSSEELKEYAQQANAEVNGSLSFLFKNVIFRSGIRSVHRRELAHRWCRSVKALLLRDLHKRRIFLKNKGSLAGAFVVDTVSFALSKLLVGWWLVIAEKINKTAVKNAE
jgi:anaerobic magnesium-protoporphyrin IX monomethyl ester cyclase